MAGLCPPTFEVLLSNIAQYLLHVHETEGHADHQWNTDNQWVYKDNNKQAGIIRTFSGLTWQPAEQPAATHNFWPGKSVANGPADTH